MKCLRYIWLCLLVCCGLQSVAQSDIFEIKDGKLLLHMDARWNKRTSDSILDLYDMSRLSMDTVVRFGNAGCMAQEGWTVKKKGKYQFVLSKDLSTDGHIDLISSPFTIDVDLNSDSEFVAHSFTDRLFGFNDFDEPSVKELSGGITEFSLKGFGSARLVFLAGSFNNWSTGGLSMTKTDNGWTARLELVPGRYEYKFIVDGKWISDPQNRQKVDDDFDGKNSVYFKTNRTFQIELPEKHREVILTGSFNNWNERQIKLHQIGNKWLVDVFLPIGTYGYKFIADGQWMTDPTNRDVRPDGAGNFNSFISIGDPYVFKLDGFPNAHQVILAGTFNEWSTVGLVMNKTAQGWELPFVLRPGYYQYKFIIDGNWMADKMQPITLTEDGQVNNFVVVHPNHVFNFYSAKATEVYVTGSFIDWREPGIPMHLEGNVWKTDAWLPQGKTTYKFLVDGQWILDPDNKLWEENEYGTGNSVLWIK